VAERVKDDHDRWRLGLEWKMKFGDPEKKKKILGKYNNGGIARRPNAVPPLSGPTPQGLTFLLGDDIVKNRIT